MDGNQASTAAAMLSGLERLTFRVVSHVSNPLIGKDWRSALPHDELVTINDAGNPRNHCLDVGKKNLSRVSRRHFG